MLGLLTYLDDFCKSQGINKLWFKDSTTDAEADNTGFIARRDYIITKPDIKGTFSFTIPLKNIFGFVLDYTKIIFGFKHELTLVRDSDANAVLRAGGTDLAKTEVSKLSWFVPHVIPSDENKMVLYKTIQSKIKLNFGFRMRLCDSISVPQRREFTW